MHGIISTGLKLYTYVKTIKSLAESNKILKLLRGLIILHLDLNESLNLYRSFIAIEDLSKIDAEPSRIHGISLNKKTEIQQAVSLVKRECCVLIATVELLMLELKIPQERIINATKISKSRYPKEKGKARHNKTEILKSINEKLKKIPNKALDLNKKALAIICSLTLLRPEILGLIPNEVKEDLLQEFSDLIRPLCKMQNLFPDKMCWKDR